MKVGFAGIIAAALGTLQALAATSASDVHAQLIDLAANNGGVVPINEVLFEQITAPNREWSVSLQFTAMAPNMKCIPCRYVPYSSQSAAC